MKQRQAQPQISVSSLRKCSSDIFEKTMNFGGSGFGVIATWSVLIRCRRVQFFHTHMEKPLFMEKFWIKQIGAPTFWKITFSVDVMSLSHRREVFQLFFYFSWESLFKNEIEWRVNRRWCSETGHTTLHAGVWICSVTWCFTCLGSFWMQNINKWNKATGSCSKKKTSCSCDVVNQPVFIWLYYEFTRLLELIVHHHSSVCRDWTTTSLKKCFLAPAFLLWEFAASLHW